MSKIVFSYSNLKDRLASRGMTQSDLARDLGISERFLGKKLESGLPFRIEHIKSICAKLNIRHTDISKYFFDGEFDHNE